MFLENRAVRPRVIRTSVWRFTRHATLMRGAAVWRERAQNRAVHQHDRGVLLEHRVIARAEVGG